MKLSRKIREELASMNGQSKNCFQKELQLEEKLLKGTVVRGIVVKGTVVPEIVAQRTIFPGIVDLLNGEAEHLHILPIDILMLLIQYLEDGFLMWMIFIFDVQSITKGNLMHKLLPIYLGSLF